TETIVGTGSVVGFPNTCSAAVNLWTAPSCIINLSSKSVQVNTPINYSVTTFGDVNQTTINVPSVGNVTTNFNAPVTGSISYPNPGTYTFTAAVSLGPPTKPTGPASVFNCAPKSLVVTAAPP